MSNSSDEDLNSSNELIDLEPLWRDRPFLSSSSSEEEAEPVPDKTEDEVIPPRINTPTPTPGPMSTSRQDMAALEASLAEINQSNYSVAAGRAARQRLIDGFASGQSQEQNVIPPRASIGLAAQQNLPESAPRRINQPRGPSRIPRSNLGRRYVSPIRRGARRRISFPSEVSDSNLQVNTSASTSADNEANITGNRDPRFVLPGAIREREEAEEARLDDATRALRSEFVSELLMSSLTTRYSRADLQNFPNRFGTNGKDPKPYI